ncbi:MAG: hypothetical protein WAT70_02175 [Rhizobiaceae bacterium]
MQTGFPTFRGYGINPRHEERLTELLLECCAARGVSAASLEATDIAGRIYGAYRRAFDTRPDWSGAAETGQRLSA